MKHILHSVIIISIMLITGCFPPTQQIRYSNGMLNRNQCTEKAETLLYSGKLSEANELYRYCIKKKTHSEYPRIQYHFGLLKKRLGHLDAASKLFSAVCKHGRSYNKLACRQYEKLNPVCKENSCSGKGTCEVINRAVICNCFDGYVGKTCNACDARKGYHLNTQKNNCTRDVCDPNPCDELHKTVCNTDITGIAKCTCDDGFSENESGLCFSPCDPNPCNEKFKTVCYADSSNQAFCDCDGGFKDFGDGTCKPIEPCSIYYNLCDDDLRECIDKGNGEYECGACMPGLVLDGDSCIPESFCEYRSYKHNPINETEWESSCMIPGINCNTTTSKPQLMIIRDSSKRKTGFAFSITYYTTHNERIHRPMVYLKIGGKKYRLRGIRSLLDIDCNSNECKNYYSIYVVVSRKIIKRLTQKKKLLMYVEDDGCEYNFTPITPCLKKFLSKKRGNGKPVCE